MRISIALAFFIAIATCLSACAPKSSAKSQTTFDDGGTVNSVRSDSAGGQKTALTGEWGLIGFTCSSGHAITPFASTLVQAKSTTLTFNNGVMRIYSTLGGCTFENYNVVAIDGDKLIYNGGQAYGKKECQGRGASTQGVSSDSPDSFTIQGDDQLILKSLSSGAICPRGDTTTATYSKLSVI